MCGRYTFFTDRELREIDEIIEKVSQDIQFEKMKTGEIFPTDIVPVLTPEKDLIVPKLMVWGIPNFHNKGVIINARSETAREKRMFSSSFENRRCIIPSTGFYEWNKEKKKYLFNVSNSQMLYMAGIYHKFDGENRFVILTAEANQSIAEVHNRMPVVIPAEQIEDWVFNLNKADNILFHEHPDLIKIIA